MSEFSSGSNSEYFRQKRTLQREGIAPATLSSIPGSSFGKAAAAKHRQGAQQSHSEQFSELRKSSGQRHEPLVHDSGRSCSSFLPRVDWLPLGEGWYQTTPIGTGSTNKAGLHSVIESSLGQFFMCLYEPRLQQVAQAVTSQNPEYNLEVSVKSLPLVSNSISAVNNSKNYGNIEIVFGFMSVTSYFSLKCMITTRSWRISRVDSNEELVLREVSDEKIRPNLFSSVLLQIRGATISVDINGVPVFTNIRGTLGENINGLVGFMAKGSRFAIKGWRLTGIGKTGQIDASSARDAKESYKSSTNTAKPQSLRELVAAKSQRDTFATDERLGPIFPHGGGGPGKPLSNSSGGSSKDCSLMELASKEAVDQLHDEFASKLYQSHEKTIVDSVLRDVVQNNLGVTFDDIASLETAKRLLNEAIVLPLILPEFFTGIRTPWKGVLLFGPPGTGKTLLAKAVCSFRTNTTFFNCSSSSLISKYRGDSEKIIRCLFDAARMCSPSIIFLDEVDALVSSRNSLGEHEASRRLKTELFSQMDGLVASTNGLQQAVMVLATTNCPWDLDEAMRRRLEKRIYIPLPDEPARLDLFRLNLREIPVTDDIDMQHLAQLSEGYSGADVHILCKEASMMPMRRLLSVLNPLEMAEMRAKGDLLVPKVCMNDFLEALKNTKPSVGINVIERYENWENEFSNK